MLGGTSVWLKMIMPSDVYSARQCAAKIDFEAVPVGIVADGPLGARI